MGPNKKPGSHCSRGQRRRRRRKGERRGPGQSLSVWGRTWHFPHCQSLRGVSTNLENLAARRRFWDLAPRPRFTSFPVSTKLPDPRTRPQPSIGPCWICRDGLRTRGIHRRVEKVPFSLESNVSENLHQNSSFFYLSIDLQTRPTLQPQPCSLNGTRTPCKNSFDREARTSFWYSCQINARKISSYTYSSSYRLARKFIQW